MSGKKIVRNALAALTIGTSLLAHASTPEPIRHSVTIKASQADVWQRWTTDDGLRTFFSRASNIDLQVGGDYEILFFPDNPPGERGAEGTKIMALEPPYRLAFDWSAPPAWPEQRVQRTMVEIRLVASGADTVVILTHAGWGDGKQWQEVRDYFDVAWVRILARLNDSFEAGPVNWFLSGN